MKTSKSVRNASQLNYSFLDELWSWALFVSGLPEVAKAPTVCPWKHEVAVRAVPNCCETSDDMIMVDAANLQQRTGLFLPISVYFVDSRRQRVANVLIDFFDVDLFYGNL